MKLHHIYCTLFSIFLFLALLGCNQDNAAKTKLSYLEPEVDLVLVMPDFETAKSRLLNNHLFQKIGNLNTLDSVKSSFNLLKSISLEGEALLAFNGQNQFKYLLVTDTLQLEENFKNADNFLKDSIVIDSKNQIRKTTLKNNEFYSTRDAAFYLQSNNLEWLQRALKQKNEIQQFQKLYELTDNQKTLSILSYKENILNDFFGSETNTINFGDYYVLDFQLDETQTKFSGVTQTLDSTKILNVFKNSKPCTTKFEQIFPASASSAVGLCLGELENFKERLSQQAQDSLPTFLNLAVEVAMLDDNNGSAIALRFPDKNTIENDILAGEVIETFRDQTIYKFATTNIFEAIFQPFVTMNNANVVFELEDFFVFTQNTEMAKEIITAHSLGQTIKKSSAYTDVEPSLSSQSSVLVLLNRNNLQTRFENLLNAETDPKFNNLNFSAFQLIYEDHFAHINGIISQQTSRGQTSELKELFSFTLENDIVGNPQFFTNHLNNSKDVLVQDSGNTLYLISKEGNIFWKKKLDGLIQGEVNEIDIYKNGRLQLAFVTDKKLYILDRNGKDVSGFPKSFNDNITQPLAVFDYDSNKNYRLLVTQKNSLIMYDKAGNTVSGFKPDLLNTNIKTIPKHFRIGNKDYIVFAQGNSLQILDRIGKTRIKVKESINFSDNEIYLHNNAFVTATSEGKLFKIDNKGNATTSELNTSSLNNICADQKTLVVFSDNKLKFNGKEVELDFGNYTKPTLFSFNDEKYISITDLQTNKAFVFNGKASLLNNFPVYAAGQLSIAKANGKYLYGVTKTDNRSLVLYRF